MNPKQIYVVMTISHCIEDDEVDQYQNVIGTYEDRAEAERIAQVITDHGPLNKLDYDYLGDYDSAVVLQLPLNGHITHQ